MDKHNKKPLFTIITATYNRTRFLEECLLSLYNQNCTDYEHIIVDGDSTNGTFELIKNITEKYKDKNIRIYQRKPKGVYDAFNFAIKEAKGKYIHFLNSDDYFANDEVLSKVKDTILENNYPSWVQGTRVMIYKNFRRTEKDPFGHQQAFLRKNVYDKVGLYSLKYRYSSDFEFYLRLREYEQPLKIDFDTVIQNMHKDSLTMSPKGYFRWPIDMMKIHLRYYSQKLRNTFGAEDRS